MRSTLGLMLCCSTAACASATADEGEDMSSHSDGHAAGTSEPIGTHGGLNASFCMDRGEFSPVGIRAEGAILSIEVVAADPVRAIADNNAWTVQIETADGPLTGAANQLSILPMMPDHGHGTPIVANVIEQDEAGMYEIAPVNLFMPGYWVVEVALDMAAVQDTATLHVCVEQ